MAEQNQDLLAQIFSRAETPQSYLNLFRSYGMVCTQSTSLAQKVSISKRASTLMLEKKLHDLGISDLFLATALILNHTADFMKGKNIPKEAVAVFYKSAIYFYKHAAYAPRRAAPRTTAIALNNLACLQAAGNGVEKDDALAFRNLLTAAGHKDYGEAMLNIGIFYYHNRCDALMGAAEKKSMAAIWFCLAESALYREQNPAGPVLLKQAQHAKNAVMLERNTGHRTDGAVPTTLSARISPFDFGLA